jgi:hypothetical protein
VGPNSRQLGKIGADGQDRDKASVPCAASAAWPARAGHAGSCCLGRVAVSSALLHVPLRAAD